LSPTAPQVHAPLVRTGAHAFGTRSHRRKDHVSTSCARARTVRPRVLHARSHNGTDARRASDLNLLSRSSMFGKPNIRAIRLATRRGSTGLAVATLGSGWLPARGRGGM